MTATIASGTLTDLYDAWHTQEDYFDGESPWHELLKPFLVDLSGKRVLEIGCGRGGFSVWLGDRPAHLRAAQVVAADFSAVAVEKAKRLGKSRGMTAVTYVRRDLMALAEPDASFDVVISCETIEHVRDPRRAIRELARVLRPSGLFCLSFPSYLNAMGMLRIYKRVRGEPFSEGGQPLNHWLLPSRVARWVTEAGVDVSQQLGVGHFLPLPGQSPRRVFWADRWGSITRWSALHQVIVGEKRV